MALEHNEGFERERLFHAALGEAMRQCPNISAGTVETIIGLLAPEFLEGLFERRPCVRKLRYLGRWWTGDWESLPRPWRWGGFTSPWTSTAPPTPSGWTDSEPGRWAGPTSSG